MIHLPRLPRRPLKLAGQGDRLPRQTPLPSTWKIPSPDDPADWRYRQVIVCDFELMDDERGTVLYIGQTASLGSRLHPRNHPMWAAIDYAAVDVQRIHLLLWGVGRADLDNVERWLIQVSDPLCNGSFPKAPSFEWREPDLALPALELDPRRRRAGPPLAQNASGVYAWIWLPENGIPKRWSDLVLGHAPRGASRLIAFPTLLPKAPDRTQLTYDPDFADKPRSYPGVSSEAVRKSKNINRDISSRLIARLGVPKK